MAKLPLQRRTPNAKRRTPNCVREDTSIAVGIRELRCAVALAAGQWDIGQRPMPLDPMVLKHTVHPSHD